MSLIGKKLVLSGTINLALLEVVAERVGCEPEQVTPQDIEKSILDTGARGTGLEKVAVLDAEGQEL